MSAPPPPRLIEAASAYYRRAGRFAWHFARSKLRGDPVFAAILARGVLEGRGTIHASDAGGARGWPRSWPAPPLLQAYRGVDINAREVARARQAFALDTGAAVQIVHGDIRDVDYGSCDAVVILDVLHYLDYPAQETVLTRARDALAARGLLLLRVGDGAATLRCTLSRAVDRSVVLARRGRWSPLGCRTLSDWQALLARCGFSAHAHPASAGRLFANWLLRAELA